MVRQAGVTGAESCWDDGFESDDDCEKYLQAQKTKMVADADSDTEEYTDDDDDDDDADALEEGEDTEVRSSADSVDDDADDYSEDDEESEESADADEESEEALSAKGHKMIKAKTTGKMTKADAIRSIIAARQEAGVEIRPRDIKAALEKKGIEVNASQISITLRAMGVPPATRGGKRPAAGRPAAVTESPPEPQKRQTARYRAKMPETTTNGREVVFEQAATLLQTAGSYDAALTALNFCKKFMRADS